MELINAKCFQVFLMVFCLAACAKAADECGKTMNRVNYGLVRTLASPVLSKAKTCDYRFRVPRGMHVQFNFSEFEADSCCSSFTVYDALRPSFKWSDSDITGSLSGVKEPGYVMTLPTSMVGVKYHGDPEKSKFSMTFIAAIPEDGNCGFLTYAMNKVRIIRSPGFPGKMYPNNLRCKWTIRSRNNQMISLKITNFNSEKGSDYLEVYGDNSVRLNRHSGKLNEKVTYYAMNGEMSVYFHTNEDTPNRGFRAYYVGLTPNKTVVATTPPTVGGEPLECYDILTSKSSIAGVVLNQKTKTTCGAGSECLRMEAYATSSMMGINQEVTTVYGGCLPAVACPFMNCSSLPSMPGGIEFTSCNVSCCDTDLCNEGDEEDSDDDEDDSGKDLQCYDILESRGPSGSILFDRKNQTTCAAGSKCLRMMAVATASAMGGSEIITTYGGCIPAVACSFMNCSSLPSAEGLEFISCDVSCCDSDLCNAGDDKDDDEEDDDEEDDDDSSVSTGEALRCFDIMESKGMSGNVLSSQKSPKTCVGESKCLRMDANAEIGDMKIKTTYGGCVPAMACSSMNCNSLPSPMEGLKFTSCDVSCCDTDLCNDKDGEDDEEDSDDDDDDTDETVSVPPPSGPVTCYNSMKMEGMGVDTSFEQKCEPQQICMLLKSTATMGPVTVEITNGACAPAPVCPNYCDFFTSSQVLPPGMKIESCDVTCCSKDLCNK